MTVVREIESARLTYTYTHTCTSLWSDYAITLYAFNDSGVGTYAQCWQLARPLFPVRAQRHYALSQPGQVALAPIPNVVVGRWPWIP